MNIDGTTLALLLMGETADSEDDWAVFPGTVRREGDAKYLDRGPNRDRFEIRKEWLSRIRPVGDDLRDIFEGCELYLPLTVGNLTPGRDLDDLELTGLKWPQ